MVLFQYKVIKFLRPSIKAACPKYRMESNHFLHNQEVESKRKWTEVLMAPLRANVQWPDLLESHSSQILHSTIVSA